MSRFWLSNKLSKMTDRTPVRNENTGGQRPYTSNHTAKGSYCPLGQEHAGGFHRTLG